MHFDPARFAAHRWIEHGVAVFRHRGLLGI